MYEAGRGGGAVAGISAVAGGVAVLPNTGGHSLLAIVGVTAIVGGAIILLSQILVMWYNHTALRK